MLERELDVRGLAHNERPPLIIGEASKLKKDEAINLIVEVEPKPMIHLLRQKGYTCESENVGDHWRVKIVKT